MVLVLDAASSSTSTSTANAEYEYEKPGKTSIETPKHANIATSKPAGEGFFHPHPPVPLSRPRARGGKKVGAIPLSVAGSEVALF